MSRAPGATRWRARRTSRSELALRARFSLAHRAARAQSHDQRGAVLKPAHAAKFVLACRGCDRPCRQNVCLRGVARAERALRVLLFVRAQLAARALRARASDQRTRGSALLSGDVAVWRRFRAYTAESTRSNPPVIILRSRAACALGKNQMHARKSASGC